MDTPIVLPGGELSLQHKPSDHDVIDLVYSNSRMPIDQIRQNRGVIHAGKEYVVQPADPECTSKFNLMPDGIEIEIDEVFIESTGAELWPGFDPTIHTFRLTSRRLKDVLNSLGTELPQIAARSTTNYAYMNPNDMGDLKIDDEDLIDISSPRSTITGVVKADKTLRRGIVSMAHSWGGTSLTDEKVRDIGTPTSRLTSAREAIDPINGMVVSSAIPVAVRPATEI
jgi:anaerobic selenocysteine-containing dehydrogenase